MCTHTWKTKKKKTELNSEGNRWCYAKSTFYVHMSSLVEKKVHLRKGMTVALGNHTVAWLSIVNKEWARDNTASKTVTAKPLYEFKTDKSGQGGQHLQSKVQRYNCLQRAERLMSNSTMIIPSGSPCFLILWNKRERFKKETLARKSPPDIGYIWPIQWRHCLIRACIAQLRNIASWRKRKRQNGILESQRATKVGSDLPFLFPL